MYFFSIDISFIYDKSSIFFLMLVDQGCSKKVGFVG